MADATIGVLQVRDLLDALRAAGADPAQLCRAAGVSPAALRDLGGRVRGSLARDILDEAEHQLRDPLVGLHAGERACPRGPLAYLLVSCPRLEWALRRCGRFSHLADDNLSLSLHPRGAVAQFVIVHEDELREPHPHVVDYVVVAIVKAIRAAVSVPGLRVQLRHGDRGAPDEFERVLGCRVRFGCPANAIAFPAHLLGTPSRFANPLVAERIEELAIALEERATRATTRARVADAVRALTIAGASTDRARVARHLGMSGRTLQRALGREGVTFKTVRDEVRWDGVHALLANPDCSVESAALSAGFADTAGFSRAFTRRTGCSPSRYRARLAS